MVMPMFLVPTILHPQIIKFQKTLLHPKEQKPKLGLLDQNKLKINSP